MATAEPPATWLRAGQAAPRAIEEAAGRTRDLLNSPQRAEVIFEDTAHPNLLPLGPLHARRLELDNHAAHEPLDGLIVGAFAVERRPIDVDQALALHVAEEPHL